VSVIVLLADGVRADMLDAATRPPAPAQGAPGPAAPGTPAPAAGGLPALARLRAEGALHTVSSVFPSVTGPAYAPFLMGRFPGPVGLPGLRWYDRSRARCRFPDFTRSYVGAEMRHVDGDLTGEAPTIFELAASKLGSMTMIGRGLGRAEHLGRGLRFALRAARTHWRGDVRGWLRIDREMGRDVARYLRTHRPDFAFAAFLGMDKTSHQMGHAAPAVLDALRTVDETAAEIRHDAERAGAWEETRLWVVSDHGHSPVRAHDDLADVIRAAGWRAIGHPRVYGAWDVAVMVSGNAMAHLYLERERRSRPWWPELAARWEPLAELLLERASVDLVILPHSPERFAVRGRGCGEALVEVTPGGRHAYRPLSGDPLGLGGELAGLTSAEAYDICAATDYPDALVQIASLAGSARAGEVIVSAARGWDFRARYEPIPHVSAHGALHRDHMLVPLLTNRPPARAPRRTADVMPSALAALGLAVPIGVEGESFE
jgi:hypothetical protein